ncbi:MAG: hypothetical protein GXW85_04730 [Clostridia bacterium]|nr:hypothetical protein [Clostridia bacterium]
MTLKQRIADLEKRVTALEERAQEQPEKTVQSDHIARNLASSLETAFIEACKAIKAEG